jgi:hypothetical protein
MITQPKNVQQNVDMILVEIATPPTTPPKGAKI